MGCCSIRGLTKEEKSVANHRALQKNVPHIVLGVFSVLAVCLGLLAFAVQIYSIVVKGPLYYVGVGIWAGTFIVISKLPNPLLIIKRTVFWQRIHLIAQLFAFAGCISMTIVNSIVERGGGGRSPYAWINRVQLAVAITVTVTNLIYTITFTIYRIRQEQKIKAAKQNQQHSF